MKKKKKLKLLKEYFMNTSNTQESIKVVQKHTAGFVRKRKRQGEDVWINM